METTIPCLGNSHHTSLGKKQRVPPNIIFKKSTYPAFLTARAQIYDHSSISQNSPTLDFETNASESN